MTFIFQQPGTSQLLDAIDYCAAGCDSIGGMFAFATKAGVELFFGLPGIQTLLARDGSIQLTVGVDAITNGETLLHLRERMSALGPRLRAKAYVHPFRGTFHPKYMWFVREDRVKLIAGSGNLTPSGLGCAPTSRQDGNWEAFLVQELDPASSAHFLRSIRDWLARATESELLLEVDHPRALARGAINSRLRFASPPRDHEGARGGDYPVADGADAEPVVLPEIVPWPLPNGTIPPRASRHVSAERAERGRDQRGARDGVRAAQAAPGPAAVPAVEAAAFVREVSRNRSGQNDVGIEGIKFFGYRKGESTTVLLQYVDLDSNVVEEPAQRNLFENASDNYRVEMPQIAQLPYNIGPNDQRMIMVAVRLDSRTFRYTIVPVTHASYATLSRFLDTKANARAGHLRKAFVDPDELRSSWAEGPRGLFPVTVISPET